VNPIWLTLIAIVSTLIAILSMREAQTAEGARRTTSVAIGLLVIGLAVAAVVLLILL
jgi:hypothetical protein